MPRPKADSEKVREILLVAAERRLRQLGSPRFSVTDLAADCRMSQSNVYRFFPNKSALAAALVERWFQEIEAELRAVIDAADRWQTKLERFVLVQLRIKSSRFDQDPKLFRAYLMLADEHPEPVLEHVRRLQDMLNGILSAAFEGEGRDCARMLVEDATLIFRDPVSIARLRTRCTPERADAVIGAVRAELERRIVPA